MIERWINEKYLENETIKKTIYQFLDAKPYPHFVLHDFLRQDKILKLRNAIFKEQFTRQDKNLFSFYNTQELRFSKSKIVKDFFNLLSSIEFLSLMKNLTKEKSLKSIDMHAHLYRQGDYLLFHDDVVEGRKIAYIIYMSEGFAAKDGGRLELYDTKNPSKPVKSIIPEFNSFLCFKVSGKSLHAVEEVKSAKERLTLGGWFYGN